MEDTRILYNILNAQIFVKLIIKRKIMYLMYFIYTLVNEARHYDGLI